MKIRIILMVLLIAGVLSSCRNDKKEALTSLDIAAGRIQKSIDPVSPSYDLIHSIRITLVTAPNEIWVMDEDGTVIYQEDSEMVGKNVISDDSFAKFNNFQAACKMIAQAESGEVAYSCSTANSSTPVDRTALWKTIRMNESTWKVIYALEN